MRKTNKNLLKRVSILFLSVLFLSACGGNGKQTLDKEPEVKELEKDTISVNNDDDIKVDQIETITFEVKEVSSFSMGTFEVDLNNLAESYELYDDVKVEILGYYPDFYFNSDSKEPDTYSLRPLNPAFIFKLSNPNHSEKIFKGIQQTLRSSGEHIYEIDFVSMTTNMNKFDGENNGEIVDNLIDDYFAEATDGFTDLIDEPNHDMEEENTATESNVDTLDVDSMEKIQNGLKIKVLGVNYSLSKYLPQDMLNVDIEVENVAEKELGFYSTNFDLYDSNGYSLKRLSIDIAGGLLQPGKKAIGSIGYKVDTVDSPQSYELYYTDSMKNIKMKWIVNGDE